MKLDRNRSTDIRRPLCLMLLAVPLLVLGCQKPADQAGQKEYDITGKVTAVNMDNGTVKLDHKDIPGLMQGMEMEFKVESPQMLDGISEGDQVQGRLQVRSGDQIITRLEKR